MTVAASRGIAVPDTAFIMALRLRIPRSIFIRAESNITMALSTSIPIAIMIAARDMRCKAIPLACI